MLKKIEFYYDNETHEQTDITDLKIYWDTVENVFRHKFECRDCGKKLGCYCFGHLFSILDSIESGYQCNKCFILSTWDEEEEYEIEVAEDIDKLYPDPGDFKKRVKIMQYLNNQDGNFENTNISQQCEKIADMIKEELVTELKNIPDEKFQYIGYSCDDWDCDGGYSCEI